MASIYTKGTRVWLPDALTGWTPGTVASLTLPADGAQSSQVVLVVDYDEPSGDETSKELKFSLTTLESAAGANNVQPTTPPPGQDALPPLRNPPLLESSEDLASLSNLNEPSGEWFPAFGRSV